MKKVQLEWVVVNQEKHHVSEFALLEPNQRPKAFCPECGKNLILKLGSKNAHHAAHHEGSICTVTQPETALHINSKYYLKSILQSCHELKIHQSCTGWHLGDHHIPCTDENKQSVSFVDSWDQVEDEWQFGTYRLDIALLKDRMVIGAIEVLVTHPTEKEKIEFLNQNNIAWLEIRVAPEFYTPPTAWNGESALTPEKYNPSIVSNWQCPFCKSKSIKAKTLVEQEKKRLEEQERKKAFAKQFKTLRARYVDYYYPSGKKYRSIYIIQAKIENNQISYIELQEVGSERRSIARENPPISEMSFTNIQKAFDLEIQRKKETIAIIDDSYQWNTNLERFSPMKYLNSDWYSYKYEMIDGKWKRTNW